MLEKKSGPEMGQNSTSMYSKEDSRYWISRLTKRSGDYWFKPQFRGERRWVNLGAGHKSEAARRASQFWQELRSNGWGMTAVSDEESSSSQEPNRQSDVTVGDYIAAFRDSVTINPRTFEIYLSKFRTIVSESMNIEGGADKHGTEGRLMWRKKVDGVSLSKITPKRVNQWKVMRLKSVPRPSYEKALRTVNNYMRNARNLFLPRNIKLIDLVLPDPLPFEGLEIAPHRPTRYQGKIDVNAIIEAGREELLPEPFKILLLGVCADEIDKLQWKQFLPDEPLISVESTDYFFPKTLSSIRKVHLDPAVSQIIEEWKTLSDSRFVVNGVEPRIDVRYHHYRCSKAEKVLVAWLRSKGIDDHHPIHMLRKEFGSLINQQGGIEAARAALGHSNIGITSSTYVENRAIITVRIGLKSQ